MTALRLSSKNLDLIAKAGRGKIQIPTYRSRNAGAVREGIVHIGVGGFHRAHLAVYVDQLMEKHDVKNYAICGVGLQPFDSAMRDVLREQDHLYTVMERSDKGSFAHVVGCINSYLYAPDNREAVIAKMAHPDTHIVSLTITESGYYYNENTHELQSEHPDIKYDATAANENAPRTTFGFLYAALARRHRQGLNPFTVMSCDNMQKNGSITRHMLESFARLRNPEVAEWIAEKGAFPNAMVDRITPQTETVDKEALSGNFGIDDSWPVVTEPFKQWVIEDKFSDGRPPFEKVGAQVVNNVHDVEQFEMHKLRLLNGSHSAIGYPGQLAGFKYVHEVMQNEKMRKFVWEMMQEEVKPLLPQIPGVDIDQYCKTLMKRFSNSTIQDQLPRICLNASGKIPQFIMPSIAEVIMKSNADKREYPFRRLCFVAAAWFTYIRGVDDKKIPFNVNDPMLDELRAAAKADPGGPLGLLEIKNLFGDDLRTDKRFIAEMTQAMKDIAEKGVLATLDEYFPDSKDDGKDLD
ncbi:Mannitol dehydrogenase [Penicillium griseofulvum]|uniref:Mannitol 2-dehydrogenase n=1 Tax=Penicillium patulum TaxID=5078 RepID=A0A135LQA4_PENPA|nr:Mannitol dehydrogenase [Penicillium griseofulvum]KXG51079.1 Mannitol dehydrogenase [Penicillium griseofulvum]